jgi:YD repeat-containing protein
LRSPNKPPGQTQRLCCRAAAQRLQISITELPGGFNDRALSVILAKSQSGTAPITSVYDAASRLVTSIQGAALTTYLYDATGNLLVENQNGSLSTYVYDNENRMKSSVASDGSSVTSTYQGYDNLRRSKRSGASVTTFVSDGSNYLGEVVS